MNGLEIVVVLGAAVFAGAALAPRLRLAPPLLQLLIGLALGFVPQLREIELEPDLVLLIFLPVMLFWESLTTSLRAIRRDFRGIVIMSTLLVVATAFAVAGIAHALGVPWAAALVLGAAVAPPDATAVAALGRTLPHRNFQLLKAESLTNDGTALVVYALAVGIAVGGNYTAADVTGLVALSYLGGLAAGIIVAGLAYLALRSLTDPILINTGLLLTPFTAYLAAELIGASGVLAVVVAGLIAGYASATISTAASRRQTEWTWPLGTGLLNGALFVLIGLEVQVVVRDLAAGQLGRLLLVTVAVWAGLLVIRFAFQITSVYLIRALDRRPAQRARRMTHRARVVSSAAGFRGAVSLAIALSVPATVEGGGPFPGRPDIVVVTAGVIVLTLLVQGPLLPAVVRWARLPGNDDLEEELRLAEREISTAAIAALPDLAARHGVDDRVTAALTHDHADRLHATTGPHDHPDNDADGGDGQVRPVEREREREQETRLRLALLDHKRDTLARLRRAGTIDDSIARRVQTRLDIEEVRLTGVDHLD